MYASATKYGGDQYREKFYVLISWSLPSLESHSKRVSPGAGEAKVI